MSSLALPWWIGIGRLALVPLAALTAWLLARLGLSLVLRRLRRLPEGAHWSERARVLFPARLAMGTLPFLMALGIVIEPAFFLQGPSLSKVAYAPLLVAIGLAAYLAAFSQLVRFERLTTGRDVRYGKRLADGLCTLLWFMPQLPIAFLGRWLLPSAPGPRLAGIACLALFTLWFVRGANVKLACLVRTLRPADARLYAIIRRAAERVGMTPPATFLSRAPMANAVSLVHSRQLVFTESAVAGLDDDALYAIALHELGHLQEPPSQRRVRAAMLLPIFVLMATFPLSELLELDVLWLALAALGLSVIAARGFRAFSRRMETRADAVAHGHHEEPGAYARALAQLHTLGGIPAVLANSTHPHLYDRLTAAGLTPDYPRPKPPERKLQFAVLFAAVLPAVLGFGGIMAAADQLRHSDAALSLALTGTGDAMWSVANQYWDANDMENAYRYYAPQAALQTTNRGWAMAAARAAAYAKRCDDAARWVEEARRRPVHRDDLMTLAEQGAGQCYAAEAEQRGRARWAAEDFAGALTHYQEAERRDLTSPWYPAASSRLLAYLGRCAEAGAELAEAERRKTDGAVDGELRLAREAVHVCRTNEVTQQLVEQFAQEAR